MAEQRMELWLIILVKKITLLWEIPLEGVETGEFGVDINLSACVSEISSFNLSKLLSSTLLIIAFT